MILSRIRNSLISFVLAATVLIFIFIRMSILPFGDNTMLVWDMDIQYSAFMSWLSDVLHGNAAFPFSLQGGMGSNSVGLLAYYLASPLNIILLLFSQKTIPYAVSFLLILKTGLSASAMQIFLDSKRRDVFSVIFACFYALSSFSVCFQYNIMWMDSFMLLPIVILGIDKILENRSPKIYIIALFFAILSNYYIGFMICIFSVVYFVLTYLYLYGYKDIKMHGPIFKRYIIGSLLSGLMTAFLLLPGILVLRQSSAERVVSIKDLFKLSATFDVTHFSRYVWAGGFDTEQGIQGQYPLVYSGAVMVFLVILSFVIFKGSRRKKIYYATILGILFISMVCVGPYLLWHGVSEPSGSYWRFAFVWIFMCIYIGYDALIYIEKGRIRELVLTCAIVILDLCYISLRNGFRLSYVINLLFIVGCIAGYYIYVQSNKRLLKAAALATVFTICLGELFYNGIKVHEIQFKDIYTSHKEYVMHSENAEQIFAKYPIKDTASRNMLLGGLGKEYNLGFMFGANSINTYSSTENQDAWDIYKEIGLGDPLYAVDNEYDYNGTALATAILGIHYLVDYKEWADFTWFRECETIGDCIIYENMNCLPLGFMVNEKAINIEWDEKSSLFDNQNLIYHALLGSEDANPYVVYAEDEIGLDRYKDYELHKYPQIFRLGNYEYTDGKYLAEENIEIIANTINVNKAYSGNIETGGSFIKGTFRNPDNKQNYVCFSIPYEKDWRAYVDGGKTDTVSGMGGMLMVPLSEGEHFVEIKYSVPGLWAGIAVSLICLVLTAIFIYREEEKIK